MAPHTTETRSRAPADGRRASPGAAVGALRATAYEIPTATGEESDGTLAWVSSEDLAGMRLVRERGPAGMAVAAGEYGWGLPHLQQMLDAEAVDVLQADVSRCGGITNLLRVDGICKARNRPLSAHCVPAVSGRACCALETLVHVEHFFDHARAERLLFDGAPRPAGGMLRPDRSRPGLGLELKRADAARFEA